MKSTKLNENITVFANHVNFFNPDIDMKIASTASAIETIDVMVFGCLSVKLFIAHELK